MYLRCVDFFADVLLGSSVIKGYPKRTLKGNRISRMKRVRFNLIKKKLNIGKLNDLQDEGDQKQFTIIPFEGKWAKIVSLIENFHFLSVDLGRICVLFLCCNSD